MKVKKDLATKKMTACKDVFSDICNVNLMLYESRRGECCKKICPEDLKRIPTELVYRDRAGDLREHRMDVRMKHTESNTEIAIFCLENQSGISNIMPVRNMGYSYSGYSEQIRGIKKKNARRGMRFYTKEIGDNQKLAPVICLILYYGTEEWTGPKTLKELLYIPEEWRAVLEPWISDYKIHIVSLAGQSEEIRDKYQSDFRHIVDYLAYRKNNDVEKLEEFSHDKTRKIVHPQEFVDMMYAFTDDKRYAVLAEQFSQSRKEGEDINMCMLLDMVEGRGTDRVNLLNITLAKEGRINDIIEAAKNPKLQKELMKQYGI